MDFRSLNVKPEIMQKAVFEITGQEYLPRFFPHVLFQSELTACLRELHQRITEEETDFKKEELFLLLIEQLLEECSEAPAASFLPEPSPEIQAVCDYLERHYTQTITLDTLSALAGLSKYHLLRSFTRQKSISPYSYLETVRIGAAKKLLEAGVSPAETAFRTGFSDQSHFSNFFKKLIGLTPRQYMKIFQQEPKTRSEDTQP
jgi:AraC-like DNA-binding protein